MGQNEGSTPEHKGWRASKRPTTPPPCSLPQSARRPLEKQDDAYRRRRFSAPPLIFFSDSERRAVVREEVVRHRIDEPRRHRADDAQRGRWEAVGGRFAVELWLLLDELCVCVVLPDIRALTCSLASTGWDFAIGVMPYGTRWRETRRTFHRFFHRMAVQKYRHVEEREVRAFLRRAVSFTKGIDMLSVSM